MVDTYVYLLDMPTAVHEMIVPGVDGYTIYLNANLTREQMLHAYKHALRHIADRDHEKIDVQRIEAAAHED